MNLFDAQADLPAFTRRLDTEHELLVACYCAAWCDTCGAYRNGFEALAPRWPQHVFVWIDIEENEVLLGDDEIDNFPTLLVQSARGNVFFGPMPPHAEQLDRLLKSVDANTPVIGAGPGALRTLLD